jgi:hypothetical protein
MRKSLLLLLIVSLAAPGLADTQRTPVQVSVEQLEQTLTSAHGMPDKQVAQQLSPLELTERLSQLRRARLEADLPGPAARQALATLADTSEFLDLPQADIPSKAMPDRAAQTSLMALTRGYVMKTILKLPNFFATRETVNYEGVSANVGISEVVSGKFEPLHEASHSGVTVLYRDNKELVANGKGNSVTSKQLRTSGEFGPILVTVLNDAASGKVTWSHWEEGASGVMAVFHYAVPEQKSHYLVGSRSIEHESEHDPAYHGEIAIDPADGSILRLTVIAEEAPKDPIVRADLLVNYGPVEIGGVTYICPLKSVAFSVVRMVVQDLDFSTGVVLRSSLGLPRNYLNEVVFTQYHLFRAETRILAGNGEGPGAAAPASTPR